MPEFTDQVGRKVKIDGAPQRIISTVPSQTELLHDLGLADEVVGITAYCVHPAAWLGEKEVIGGTKNLQIEKIRSLAPDLIIGNKEENVKEQIEELERIAPVWLSDVKNIDDAVDMISAIGAITQTKTKAEILTENLRSDLLALRNDPMKLPAAYFIWKDPYMLASEDSFISSMMELCGLENVVSSEKGRYPKMEVEELRNLKAQVVLLSSEPYSFQVRDLHELQKLFPEAIFKIVDGQYFSWYGSRISQAIPYLGRIKSEFKLLRHTYL